MSIVQRISPIGIRRPAGSGPDRVVVDGTALDTGHRERGIGRYVSGLLSGFALLFVARMIWGAAFESTNVVTS